MYRSSCSCLPWSVLRSLFTGFTVLHMNIHRSFYFSIFINPVTFVVSAVSFTCFFSHKKSWFLITSVSDCWCLYYKTSVNKARDIQGMSTCSLCTRACWCLPVKVMHGSQEQPAVSSAQRWEAVVVGVGDCCFQLQSALCAASSTAHTV